MPKIEFESGFKKKSQFDYPKLTLDQNEKARICVIDSPVMEYVHTLRKVVTENGRPIMTVERYGKNQEKTRDVPETDFVGQRVCLGELDVLEAKGVDPDRCPACAAAVENGAAVESPRRRFAVHVIKYQTKKGTFNPQNPFQVELLAWVFAEGRFGQLIDIREEHGNLPAIDLLLGPCTNKGYQKYDIMTGGAARWGADDESKKRTREVIKENRSDDLTPLLGRKVLDNELRSEVMEVVRAYNFAFGQNDANSMPATANTNADNDLTSLLGDDENKDEPTPAAKPESAPGADPWDTGTEDTGKGADTTAEPAAEDKPAKAEKTDAPDEVEDLESLLSGL